MKIKKKMSLKMVTFMDVPFMLNLGFALLLQFSFNSLALPLLTSFRFSTPPFFALLQRLCFFGYLFTAI